VLPGVVDSVAVALRLPYAAIEVEQAGRLERVAAHGEPGGPVVALPLSHGGVRLGQLVLGLRPGDDAFSPADSRVLADLAEHAGQAMYAVRLTADLHMQCRINPRGSEASCHAVSNLLVERLRHVSST